MQRDSTKYLIHSDSYDVGGLWKRQRLTFKMPNPHETWWLLMTVPYKHLKVVDYHTNDKYISILDERLFTDISWIPISQDYNIGDKIVFKYKANTNSTDFNPIDITTHNMLEWEYDKKRIESVYIAIIDEHKDLIINTVVASDLKGPCNVCFVN